jgi:RHS repeat-associated protein
MQIPGRSFSVGSKYRYGFNGKENDNEVKGEGNQQDYGMRIYDPRVGRFLSVDPITRSYPMLTPYQFASNRPIDGVDLDGLEYLTIRMYNLGIIDGKLTFRKIVEDHTMMSSEEIKSVHGISSGEFYRQFSRTFGKEGRGIKWIYYNQDGTQDGDPQWEMKQEFGDLGGLVPTESEMEYHGIYSGGGCITIYGPRYKHFGPNTVGSNAENNPYDFSRKPIDEADDISRTHDMMQDVIVDYQGWLEDTRTLDSDNWLIAKAEDYLKAISVGNTPGLISYTDRITNRPVSLESGRRAQGITGLFGAAITYKNWKVAALESMGLDPNNAKHQGAVTLKDWKPRFLSSNWFKKQILNASGGGKSKEQMAEYWKPKK